MPDSNLKFLRSCFGAIFFNLLIVSSVQAEPQICKLPWFDSTAMEKFATTAVSEAKKKKIDLSTYKSIFAVKTHSRLGNNRKIIGVRVSTHQCDEHGLDGGGFDVELDPTTFEVIESYLSDL